nr:MAG: RNA-dependent RNA polymerase [XiangYun qin-like virus]
MSRVFDVPRYVDQAWRTCKAYLDLKADDVPRNVNDRFELTGADSLTMGAMDIDCYDLRTLFADLDMEYPEESKQEEFANYLGRGKSFEVIDGISEMFKDWAVRFGKRVTRFFHDDDAIFRILLKLWNAEWAIQGNRTDNWLKADEIAASLAIIGSITDKLTTAGSLSTFREASALKRAQRVNGVAFKCYTLAEAFRMSVDTKVGRDHIRKVINENIKPDIAKCEIIRGHLKESLPDLRIFRVMNIVIIHDGTEAYILDTAACNEIHETLRTPFGFFAYAAGYRPAEIDAHVRALNLATACFDYVVKSMVIRRNRNRSFISLAKQMKESYAVLLGTMGSDAGEGLQQVDAIRDSAMELTEGEEPFFNVLLAHDHDLSADIGTFWNVLPAADADVSLMDARLQRVYNADRECDEQLWAKFMDYSRSVLTAHILTDMKEHIEIDKWVYSEDVEDPRQEPWVQHCVSGFLDYPNAEDRGKVYLKGVLPWTQKVESWHFGAQDVTHVFASLAKYATSSDIALIPRTDGNELAYALNKGPYLSDDILPSEVRRGMRSGNLPGDRVLLLAAKRENTKYGEKVRETASGDDVLREALSELDYNAQSVARVLHGVAMRMGRVGFEKRMQRMRLRSNEGQVFISLDVSAWSPNMNRKNQMSFIDMVMGFFDIPETMRASSWFKDIKIVNSKRGFHSVWDMTDGSIQGFFGCCDSIMHNLMAQFAKVVAVEEGHLDERAKVDFTAMIDDLAIKIINCDANVINILRSFENTYRRLGFETDLVKTLVSQTHFHFLNRLFSERGEVLTSAKIFAKSGREFEKRISSVWTQMDSCMGSVLGAVDRGSSPITSYQYALMMAVKVAMDININVSKDGWELTHFGAWLPRCFGGWGLPGIISWITQEGIEPITDGICRLKRLIRLTTGSDKNASINYCLNAALSQKLRKRNVQQAISNPFGLAVDGVIDPDSPGRKVLHKGAERMVNSPDFVRLLRAKDQNGLDDLLEALAGSVKYPVEIWASFADTLPMAVLEKILSRAEENEIVLLNVSAADRHAAVIDTRDLNEKAIRYYKKIRYVKEKKEFVAQTGSGIIAELREEQLSMDGVLAYDFVTTPSLEVLAKTADEGSIIADQPSCTPSEMYSGRSEWSVQRTYKSSSAIVDTTGAFKMHDPVVRSAFSLSITLAAVRAIGGNANPLLSTYSAIWFGNPAALALPEITVTATDPRRICNKTSNISHSVMAMPNFVGAIHINASKAIRRFENVKRTFDWLSVVVAAKALVTVNTELRDKRLDQNGVRIGHVYHYNLSGHSGFDRDARPPDEMPSPKWHSLLAKQVGILDKVNAIHVLKLMGMICEKLQGEDPNDDHFKLQASSFGYIPEYTTVTFSPFDALMKMGYSKTIFEMNRPSAYSPLTQFDSSIVEPVEEFETNADVITPEPSHKRVISSAVNRERFTHTESDMVKALIKYAVAVGPVLGEDQAAKELNILKLKLSKITEWQEFLKHWGNGHFIKLIEDGDTVSAGELHRQILLDFNHPKGKGFEATGFERARKMSEYAYTYAEQSRAKGVTDQYRYKKMFSSYACHGLAAAAISRYDSVQTMVEVGTAYERAAKAITSRYFNIDFQLYPVSNAVIWLENKGALANDIKQRLESALPDDFLQKASVITGALWSAADVESWVVKDIMFPEATKEYVKVHTEKNLNPPEAPEEVIEDAEDDFDTLLESLDYSVGSVGIKLDDHIEELLDGDAEIEAADVCNVNVPVGDEWNEFVFERGYSFSDVDNVSKSVISDFFEYKRNKRRESKRSGSDVV